MNLRSKLKENSFCLFTFVGFLLGDSVGDLVGFLVGCFDGAWLKLPNKFQDHDIKIKLLKLILLPLLDLYLETWLGISLDFSLAALMEPGQVATQVSRHKNTMN
jgi:hypothetical protein